jgi:pyridoxal/pyridoxine/pyridoxamine kinase
MTENTMLSAALAYSRQGVACLALVPNQKIPLNHPLQPNGSKSATTDEETLTKIFNDHADANLGIACGDSFVCVDIDGREGEEAMVLAGLKIPSCRKHRTPRGFHILLEPDTDLSQTAGLFTKVDVRNGASNGYIVAPPSIVDGKRYEVFSDLPLGRWDELVEYARANKQSSRPHTGVTEGWGEVTQPSWVSEYLSGGAPDGQRNDVAARLAGYLNSKRIPVDVARQLLETFRLACDPPMDERELDQTIQSIYRYVPAEDVFVSTELSAPVVDQSVANRRTVRWADEDLIAELSRITDNRSGLDCRILFRTHTTAVYGPVRLNLLSSSSRESLIRQLKTRNKEVNWSMALDQITNLVSTSLDDAGSGIDMRYYTPSTEKQGWAIRPFVQDRSASLVFGTGGEGKSTMVVAMLLSKASGRAFLPNIARHRIEVLAIDSLVASSGSEHSPNDAEAARVWHQVVSSFGIASIGITHIAKSSTNKDGTPYGSVFYFNLARSIFQVSREVESEHSSVLAVAHRKGNNTGIMKTMGLRAEFESDEFDRATKITYSEADLNTTEVLATTLSVTDRILYAIKDIAMEPKEIAEELDIPSNTVRQALLRAKERKLVDHLPNGQYKASPTEDVTTQTP